MIPFSSTGVVNHDVKPRTSATFEIPAIAIQGRTFMRQPYIVRGPEPKFGLLKYGCQHLPLVARYRFLDSLRDHEWSALRSATQCDGHETVHVTRPADSDRQGLRIESIEQPLAKGQATEMARLADELEIPLMADESLCTRADADLCPTRSRAIWLRIWMARRGRC